MPLITCEITIILDDELNESKLPFILRTMAKIDGVSLLVEGKRVPKANDRLLLTLAARDLQFVEKYLPFIEEMGMLDYDSSRLS